MFSTNHFIWIAICIVFIAVLMFAAIKWKFNFKTATFVVVGISFASEICKIFTHINSLNDENGNLVGGVLEAGALPFHLCSILIFVFVYLAFSKNEKMVEMVKSFAVPISLIGGTMAILMATSGVNFAKPFAYQCFIYHAGIIWYAIYLLVIKEVDLGFKAYIRNIIILLVAVFVMLWVNSILQVYDTNFFFVVRPPADNLPILNLNHGWFAYFFSLIGLGLVLVTLLHLPFILKEKKIKQ